MPILFFRQCTICVLLVWCLASASAAEHDRPADYAHRIPVTVSGAQAVVQLPLPRAVYLKARSADLSDLRLFDSAGTSIPFALITQVEQARETTSNVLVGIFPVRGPVGSTGLPPGLEIQTGESGTTISVTPASKRSADETLLNLVLDLQVAARASATVSALTLTLPPEVKNYSAQLLLETSNDLQEWKELSVTSVSWLVNSQGASVRKDRIAFEPRAFRFARMRWLEGKPIEFAAIKAELLAQQRASARWESVVLQPSSVQSGTDLIYDAPIAVPVQALGLELLGQNVVMPVLIGHYSRAEGRTLAGNGLQQLQSVINSTFFQLMQNGQRRVSGDVEVPLTHASQWVVRPRTDVKEAPGLRLRWKPASMVFVAGGNQAYTLAFGNRDVSSTQVPLNQVAPGFSMTELARLERAKIGEMVQQHQDVERGSSLGARVVWLWLLLVGGVTVLAVMAYKLSRQMHESRDSGQRESPP